MSKINVQYTSFWEEGEIVTSAILDTDTGVVSEIISSSIYHYQYLINEKISFDGVYALVDNDNEENEYMVSYEEDLKLIIDAYNESIKNGKFV